MTYQVSVLSFCGGVPDFSSAGADRASPVSGYTRLFTRTQLANGFAAQNGQFTGSLSKGSGSFLIDHPLPELSETHNLVHSFIEGPQADLIYRGQATLVNGQATVDIDLSAGMTAGTFELLCRDVQCFTSNESSWSAVKGTVNGSSLVITCEDVNSADTVSWLVIGERKDSHMLATEWTDDQGRVIVEPLKTPTQEHPPYPTQ